MPWNGHINLIIISRFNTYYLLKIIILNYFKWCCTSHFHFILIFNYFNSQTSVKLTFINKELQKRIPYYDSVTQYMFHFPQKCVNLTTLPPLQNECPCWPPSKKFCLQALLICWTFMQQPLKQSIPRLLKDYIKKTNVSLVVSCVGDVVRERQK